MARNPADAVDPPRPPKTEMKALTEAETAALLRVAEMSSLYLPILVAVVTGLRRGELLGLRWSDIEFGTGETSVQRTLEQTNEGLRFKEPKTQKASRTVMIPAIAVDALKAHKVHQAETRLMLGPAYEDHGLVFARADGSPWPPDTFSTAFAALIRRSGFPHIRFHDLRHSHASQLLRQGGHRHIAYNSCRNRHCPKCQGAAAKDWLAARQAELLLVPYYHVVFTLPARIADIAYQNKAEIYTIQIGRAHV